MAVRIGINGFGRTARQFLKAALNYHRDQLEVVAFNARADIKTYAHLFKYDSNNGIYPGRVETTEDSTIVIDGKSIKFLRGSEPSKIPWSDYGVEIVIEATGRFTAAEEAAGHMNGSVKKVIVSAASRGADVTIVLGVNEGQYDPAKHRIISNASCTTNCFAPIVKVLHQGFGIKRGLMTTVHSVTNDQVVLDQAHGDLRRGRSSGMNIIPTTTGAARAVIEVIPELKGKLNAIALRVPTSTVSIIDFVADLEKKVTVEEVNQAFRVAAEGELKGIIEYCDEPLVSSDFMSNPASAIFDALSTMVIGDNMVKVLAWYDNEWGYSCRLADLAAYIASKGL
jgi:glyceraldehyde 3-phosphate dehydrogenase